jgi:hypothetical protein
MDKQFFLTKKVLRRIREAPREHRGYLLFYKVNGMGNILLYCMDNYPAPSLAGSYSHLDDILQWSLMRDEQLVPTAFYCNPYWYPLTLSEEGDNTSISSKVDDAFKFRQLSSVPLDHFLFVTAFDGLFVTFYDKNPLSPMNKCEEPAVKIIERITIDNLIVSNLQRKFNHIHNLYQQILGESRTDHLDFILG